jgi:hypothetical protein
MCLIEIYLLVFLTGVYVLVERRTATFLQQSYVANNRQLPCITRAFASSVNASLVPETHRRSYGQPVFETHPYALQKNEGNMSIHYLLFNAQLLTLT